MYYSIKVNEYASEHRPEGFRFPQITDFWKSLVVAVGTQVVRVTVKIKCAPLFFDVVKGKDDEELKMKYAQKCADYSFSTIQYMIVTIWGFLVLRETKRLPWFMGGRYDSTIAFESTMVNNPFCEFS